MTQTAGGLSVHDVHKHTDTGGRTMNRDPLTPDERKAAEELGDALRRLRAVLADLRRAIFGGRA